MKNTIRFLGIIAVMAIIGLSVTSCGGGGGGGGGFSVPNPTPIGLTELASFVGDMFDRATGFDPVSNDYDVADVLPQIVSIFRDIYYFLSMEIEDEALYTGSLSLNVETMFAADDWAFRNMGITRLSGNTSGSEGASSFTISSSNISFEYDSEDAQWNSYSGTLIGTARVGFRIRETWSDSRWSWREGANMRFAVAFMDNWEGLYGRAVISVSFDIEFIETAANNWSTEEVMHSAAITARFYDPTGSTLTHTWTRSGDAAWNIIDGLIPASLSLTEDESPNAFSSRLGTERSRARRQ